MLIVIEGADKTGKTTLAQEISTKLGYEYHHFGAPGPNPADEYAEFLIALAKPTVCDRFYYGENVYGPLLRGKSLITPLQKIVIERLCRVKSGILIHARPPLDVVQHRMGMLGDKLITKAQNEKAYAMFNHVLHKSTMPKYIYDSSQSKSLENFMKYITMVLEEKVKSHPIYSGIGTIEGPRNIFVGDTVNNNVTWKGLPFDAGSSSKFLQECLDASLIPEDSIYMVNSNTVCIAEVQTWYEKNDKINVLALGNNASVRLNQLGVKHTMVAHPSFWKRFKRGQKQTYIKHLEVGCRI